MAEYPTNVCEPWITREDFINCCDDIDENTSPEFLDGIINIVSNSLYILSGAKFKGLCEKEVLVLDYHCNSHGGLKKPILPGEIYLGSWPITEIVSITFNGIEQMPERDEVTGEYLTPPDYQINAYRFIQKLDGPWPIQDYTIVITFKYGVRPPYLGVQAAKSLSAEIVKGCNDKECAISDRVTSVARRGISLSFNDYEQLAQDFIGNYFVDLFLQTYNPTKSRTKSFAINTSKSPTTRRLNT